MMCAGKTFEDAVANFNARDVDRSEFGEAEFAELDVVVAGDGDVLRHT